ncbi:MAG: NAD(P)H-dependent oxidoreductase [Pseudomonadota bacterium]
MQESAIHLLGVSGSLRAGSINSAILRTLQDKVPEGVVLDIFPLDRIPLYNQDHDGACPPADVARFKDAIAKADGLVICTPEYGFGISGVLKNALDWASRPAFGSPLKDKPSLVMSASPAFTGGVRAHGQVRETLVGALARVIARPPVVIGSAHTKVVDGRLVDEANLKFATDAVADLIEEVRMLCDAKAWRRSRTY